MVRFSFCVVQISLFAVRHKQANQIQSAIFFTQDIDVTILDINTVDGQNVAAKIKFTPLKTPFLYTDLGFRCFRIPNLYVIQPKADILYLEFCPGLIR